MQVVKESIFVSAIRSFFNAFLAMIGVEIGLVMLVVLAMTVSSQTPVSTGSENFVMEILPDSEGNTTFLPDSAPVLLQVDVEGVIGMDDLNSSMFETGLRLSQHSTLIKSGRVKGILVNIISPGGSAYDSDEMYRSLKRYKEKYNVPIYVYTAGICASGGYMVACAGDKIYAAPSSIIGSVGVKTSPFFNISGLMEKYGVKAVELSEGKNKIKYPMFTPLAKSSTGKDSDASYADLAAITEQLYDQFTTLVSESREQKGLTKNLLITKYGAQVYLAPEAVKLGYIDETNTYRDEVLQELAKASGIEQNTKYQVVRFKHKRSPLQSLVTSSVNMWTLKAKEWIYGIKHEGLFDKKFLYYCDFNDG